MAERAKRKANSELKLIQEQAGETANLDDKVIITSHMTTQQQR